MPRLRPCAKWGCAELVEIGRCAKHAAERLPDSNARSESKAAYAKAAWRKTRAAVLAAHPVCEDCGTAMANEVHHIVKRLDGGDMSRENLRALCKPCHTRRTARGE